MSVKTEGLTPNIAKQTPISEKKEMGSTDIKTYSTTRKIFEGLGLIFLNIITLGFINLSSTIRNEYSKVFTFSAKKMEAPVKDTKDVDGIGDVDADVKVVSDIHVPAEKDIVQDDTQTEGQEAIVQDGIQTNGQKDANVPNDVNSDDEEGSGEGFDLTGKAINAVGAFFEWLAPLDGLDLDLFRL